MYEKLTSVLLDAEVTPPLYATVFIFYHLYYSPFEFHASTESVRPWCQECNIITYNT